MRGTTAIADWGFHQYDGFPGSDRAIRFIARTLFDPSRTEPRLTEDAIIWVSLDKKAIGYDQTATCGWKPAGLYPRGAIWRYKNVDVYWEAPSGRPRDFTAPGDYSGYQAYVREFTITDGSAELTPMQQIANGVYSAETDTTTWTIPNVDENPTFLQLDID